MRPTDRTGIAVIVSVALASLTVRPLTTDGSFLALSWLLIGLIGGIGIALRRLAVRRRHGARGPESPVLAAVLARAQRPDARVVGEPWFAHYAALWAARHRAHAHPGLADGAQRRRHG